VSQMGTSALWANASCYRSVTPDTEVFEGVEHDSRNRETIG
jgi:hypothetical protein